MKVKKAVITAAAPYQRKLPLQTLYNQEGIKKSVLEILIEEVIHAGINEICVVIHPGDEASFESVLGSYREQIKFMPQEKPLGYGHALFSAASFAGDDPFLHLVGDHIYVRKTETGSAQHLVSQAEKYECSISAVQATRENLIPHFGVVGGSRIQGNQELYQINKVIEKPTPTEAEQKLMVPGLRTGYYLCFFGMHVLTSTIMKILHEKITADPEGKHNLSDSLNALSQKEQYFALEKTDLRFDMGTRYGLMKAQLAIALNGKDRDRVMSELLEFFVTKDLSSNNQ